MNMGTTITPHAHDSAANELERDAALAYETLSAQVTLISRRASTHARILGDVVRMRYREALLASMDEPSRGAWRRFVAALWSFMRELDRFAPEHSVQSAAARGALDRIVCENLDLLG